MTPTTAAASFQSQPWRFDGSSGAAPRTNPRLRVVIPRAGASNPGSTIGTDGSAVGNAHGSPALPSSAQHAQSPSTSSRVPKHSTRASRDVISGETVAAAEPAAAGAVAAAQPGESTSTGAAATTTSAGAATAPQTSPTAQSEYVEEYETVYETESEEAAAAAAAAPAVTAGGGSGGGGGSGSNGGGGRDSQAEGAPTAGEALAETEAAAPAPASTDRSVAAREQAAPEAVTLLALPAPPYGTRLAAVSYAGGGGGVALGGTTVGGWALAAAMLLAIRLSREAADAERMDLEALQARQAEGRSLDAELRAKRQAYLEAERRRTEEEAARRVAEAKARQEEEARLTAERQRQWQEEAAREEQRMREAQVAAKRVYEEREARLAGELAARLEAERRLREEAEARRREEAEARKRAEAEAAARAAEARAAAAAAEAAQRAAEAAARAEAERRLRLASIWYTLGFRGRVIGGPAPPGTTVQPPASAATGLLRGPPAARLVLDCSMELSYVARTAPTLDASIVAAAAPASAALRSSELESGSAAAAAAVTAASSEAAAAGATLRVAAAELGPAAAAAAGTSGRPYESAAAAVEGAVDLAAAAAVPLAQLLAFPAWLAALPLQPPPGEALQHALCVGGGAAAEAAPGTATTAAATVAGPASPILVAPAEARAESGARLDSGGAAAATATGGHLVADTAAGEGFTNAAAAAALAEVELRHWGRMAHLQLLSSGRQVLCQLAPLLGPKERLEQEFECRLSRQVPPPPGALPAAAAALAPAVAPSLERAASAAAAGQLQRCVDVLDGVIAREEATLAAGRDGAASGAALPPLAVAALLYAELMEAAGYRPPATAAVDAAAAEGSSASGGADAATTPEDRSVGAGGEGAGAEAEISVSEGASEAVAGLEKLARHQLKQRARGAPADSLSVTAQMLVHVLPGGSRHPVCRIMARLAEDNMGLGTRQALQIRRQRAALEAQAAEVLAQQRGGGAAAAGGALVVGPGGAADARGSLVPTPERLWASRNVANNLLRFGEPLAAGEAVRLLEEAVSVARSHYGERHPAQLAVLIDLLDALAAEAEAGAGAGAGTAVEGAAAAEAAGPGGERRPPAAARREAAATELLEIVQALCERYQASRDPLSCVLLLEAAVAETQPVLRRAAGGGGRALAAASELAGELMYALKPPEARTVMTARRERSLPRLLRRLGRDFSEELGAYATGKRNRWLDAWNAGRALPPLRP